VSSSLKLIAGEVGKRRQFFRLLAELKPYANNHTNITQTSHKKFNISWSLSLFVFQIHYQNQKRMKAIQVELLFLV
jgi:hypothetical protein